FSLGGSQLTIRGGGINNQSSISQTFADPMLVGAAQSWLTSNGNLVFLGPITLNNSLTVSGGLTTLMTGPLAGNGPLTKSGTGSLTIGNGAADTVANSYNGVATISAGSLILDKAAGTLALAGDVVSNGGTITANRSGQFATSANLTLSGGVINFGSSNTIGAYNVLFG